MKTKILFEYDKTSNYWRAYVIKNTVWGERKSTYGFGRTQDAALKHLKEILEPKESYTTIIDLPELDES